jgi:hypothetical protein
MPCVRRLTIHFEISYRIPFSIIFPWTALAKITVAFPLLESLILNPWIKSFPSREEYEEYRPAEDPVHFAHLRHVTCKLDPRQMADTGEYRIKRLRSAIEKWMPTLCRTPDKYSEL